VTGDQVIGRTACRGYANGRARIIAAPQTSKEFNKGDILITWETTPDFIAFMKIAGAIVTNRGGVTSHAAIVSRELNVPCVIDTKNATEVFKDGDLVEVDATKGIVRKINQK
jgi:pyruvate,water dikinase